MIAGTHIAFASALYLGGAALFEYETDLIGWALAAAASLLPDADLPTSKLGRALFWLSTRLERRFGHRTLTHSFVEQVWFWCVVGGYWSHPWIDMLNIRGADLLWPSPIRVVMPGNRNWRLEVGSKGEMVLLTSLLVACLALYPVSGLGFRGGLQRLLGNFEMARDSFIEQAGTKWFTLELEATDNRRRSGRRSANIYSRCSLSITEGHAPTVLWRPYGWRYRRNRSQRSRWYRVSWITHNLRNEDLPNKVQTIHGHGQSRRDRAILRQRTQYVVRIQGDQHIVEGIRVIARVSCIDEFTIVVRILLFERAWCSCHLTSALEKGAIAIPTVGDYQSHSIEIAAIVSPDVGAAIDLISSRIAGRLQARSDRRTAMHRHVAPHRRHGIRCP